MDVLKVYILLILSAITACNADKAKQEVQPVEHIFYYYPKANVYIDSTTGTFFYLDSSGIWTSTKQMAPIYAEKMDTNVYIANPADPVWLDNENHRIVYAVSLYATSKDLKEEPKKIEKKKQDIKPDAELEKKDETKVGKFLRKIFGKKNKDDE